MMCGTTVSTAVKSANKFLWTTTSSAFPVEADNNDRIILEPKRSMKFRSKVFVNHNVTYYGMIAAIFERT